MTDAADLLAMDNDQLHRVAVVLDAARDVRNYYAPKFREPPATEAMRRLFDAVRALDGE